MAITLLPPELKPVRAGRFFGALLKLTAPIVFIYLLLILVLGGLFLLTKIRLSQETEQFGILQKDVEGLKDQEVMLFIFRDRLKSLSSVSRPQAGFSPALKRAIKLAGEVENSEIVDVVNTEGDVRFSIAVEDTFALERLFDNLKKEDKVKEVILENLTRSSEGVGYIASLILKL